MMLKNFSNFFFITLLLISKVLCSSWYLSTDTRGDQLFDDFVFLSADVKVAVNLAQYVNQQDANNSGLLTFDSNDLLLGSLRLSVDTNQQNTESIPSTRKSIRIQSKATYGDGIYILDMNHFPSGCGVWPAFWTRSRTAESKQEIDIFENVNNLSAGPIIALHTDQSCMLAGVNETDFAQKMTGNLRTNVIDCHEKDEFSPGCVGYYHPANTQNASHLGQASRTIIVMQRDLQNSHTVQTWAFVHQFPQNLLFALDQAKLSAIGQPNQSIQLSTDQWQKPNILFSIPPVTCQEQWMDHYLVLNTALCGAWAVNSYGYSGCAELYGNCQDQIRTRPDSLTNAFWSINSITVFAGNGFFIVENPKTGTTKSTSQPSSAASRLYSSYTIVLSILLIYFLMK